MKVTILERSKGKWRLRIETKDVLGQRKFIYETFQGTRAAAEARAVALRRAPELHKHIKSQSISVGFKEWVETRCDYGEIRPSTASLYNQIAKPMLKLIGHIKLDEFDRRMVDALYKTLVKSCGPQRTNMMSILLRAYLKSAVANELIAVDPSASVSAPKAQKKIKKKTLTKDQMEMLVEHSRNWGLEGLMIRFAMATGCRRGEICAMQWPDFDLVKGTVQVSRSISLINNVLSVEPPKTESGNRMLVIPKAMVQELLMLRQGGTPYEWVFHEDGKMRNPHKLTQFVTRRLKEVGLGEFTLHDLRHAHATFLLGQRLPLKAVSQRLGHSDVRVTLGIYTHVLPGDDETLANAMNCVF
jgi:integrase